MVTLSRSQLIDNLMQHQQAQDFVAQAETLFALAKIAREEEEYSLAQGLYAQAWAACEKDGNRHGTAFAIHGIADVMANWDVWGNLESLWWLVEQDIGGEFNRDQVWMLYDMALGVYIEVCDIRAQAQIYVTMAYVADTFNERGTGQCAYILSFACYKASGSIGLQWTPETISEQYQLHQPASRALIDHFLALYRSAGCSLEGAVALAMADTALWAKDYATAYPYYERAYLVFEALGDREQGQYILSRIGRIAHRTRLQSLSRVSQAGAGFIWTDRGAYALAGTCHDCQ